jgi:hypothetical protein
MALPLRSYIAMTRGPIAPSRLILHFVLAAVLFAAAVLLAGCGA